ncbi:MAG: hypothetical protein M1548_01560 [Actinobacteria bacterium]|nr:hypothetical protein [Actinomycetota bacterium]
MNSLKRILISAPIHEIKAYSIREYIENTISIDYPLFDIYLVDNSQTPDFAHMLSALYLQVMIDRLEFDSDNYNNRQAILKRVVKSCNKIRGYFLANNYDYLLSLECDVLIPRDGLKTLLDDDRPIVSGLSYPGFYPDIYWQQSDLIEEQRGTFGCTLISRELLQEFSFRYDPECLDAFHDAFFIYDIYKAGYSFWVDCSVKCVHLSIDDSGNRGWGLLPAVELGRT